MKVLEATAITKVYGEGQKTIGVSLMYDRVRTEEEVRNTEYTVEGRNIREIFVNHTGKLEERETEGTYVILKLDRWDPEASTKTMEGKGRDARVHRVSPSLRIRQGKESFITDREQNLTADQFRPFIFRVPETGKELAYNLFVPEGMEAGRQYPLVLFMHDAGSCSVEMQAPLIQGNGGNGLGGGRSPETPSVLRTGTQISGGGGSRRFYRNLGGRRHSRAGKRNS